MRFLRLHAFFGSCLLYTMCILPFSCYKSYLPVPKKCFHNNRRLRQGTLCLPTYLLIVWKLLLDTLIELLREVSCPVTGLRLVGRRGYSFSSVVRR